MTERDATVSVVPGPTVLLVEDEALVLDIAEQEFTEAGYRVLSAQDASEALAHLSGDAPIDLLFTDIRMPGELDGWALARQARALRPRLPVVYATGYSTQMPQAVEGALLFTKPYRLADILSAARRLLQSGQP